MNALCLSLSVSEFSFTDAHNVYKGESLDSPFSFIYSALIRRAALQTVENHVFSLSITLLAVGLLLSALRDLLSMRTQMKILERNVESIADID